MNLKLNQKSEQQNSSSLNFKTIQINQYQIYGQISENGLVNGYAEIRFNSKLIFAGEFVNSLRNGYGIQYQNQEIIYEGYYINDLKDGWGKTAKYQGQYYKGKRNGFGRARSKQEGGLYEGYWKNDKYDGIGIKYYDQKLSGQLQNIPILNYQMSDLEENFLNSDQAPEKQIYLGQWKDGKRSGRGKFRSKEESYQGEFLLDEYNGQGTIFRQKETAKGLFVKGKLVK